ncbi:MAG: DUF882 domain-containing protein [Rhodobiaceae bacterium]|jgi:zinc D-Ala-D-Ala carboxypeptidase|nr:DUF882 domain-containing protein [Rhodobiaceae bacterium]MBT5517694.1 DUF882 domain-containing protein [Rhodobiaceae bacterium]
MKLSAHFILSELTRSQTAARLGLANQPSASQIAALKNLCEHVLEPVRGHFQTPIHPSSGYRSPALNAAIGGSANSQHCGGEAVDFAIAGVDHRNVVAWIEKNIPFDQLILEFPQAEDVNAGWVHVSLVTGHNRRQSLTKTRNGVFVGFSAF